MAKLNDTQLVILSTAAQRTDGTVLPVSDKITVKPETVRRTLNRLLKAGLVMEGPACNGAEFWRSGQDDERLMLIITDDGRQAIGVEVEAAADDTNPASEEDRPRRDTKQKRLVDLLSRPGGGTIAEAMEATGWQPHSVRGAISGTLKKKLGLAVTSDVVEGRGRVYRIAADV